MQSKSQDEQFRAYYRTLRSIWGGPHWWPARTRFEVIIGAYLTQNTAWTNVEQALRGMRAAGLLSIAGVRRASFMSSRRPSARQATFDKKRED